jgi:hypothetical protein
MTIKTDSSNKIKNSLSKQAAEILFRYDPASGNLLRRNSSRGCSQDKPVGTMCYEKDNDGVYRPKFKKTVVAGIRYHVSKIVYLLHYGYMPRNIIYLDGDPTNTRIENLKAADCSEVQLFENLSINNTTGYKGVSFVPKTNNYRAYAFKDGKQYHAGVYDTPLEAYKAALKKKLSLYGFLPEKEMEILKGTK